VLDIKDTLAFHATMLYIPDFDVGVFSVERLGSTGTVTYKHIVLATNDLVQ